MVTAVAAGQPPIAVADDPDTIAAVDATGLHIISIFPGVAETWSVNAETGAPVDVPTTPLPLSLAHHANVVATVGNCSYATQCGYVGPRHVQATE